MPFLLEKGGNHVALEVQRWQFFLKRRGFTEVGAVDGFFGDQTVTATKLFQQQGGIQPIGKLDQPTIDVARDAGYVVVPNDYYSDKSADGYPARLEDLRSPSNEWRNDTFGCFIFIQHDRQFRDRAEQIVIKSSCDDAVAEWGSSNIVRVVVPQLIGVSGARADGMIRCHRLAASRVLELFKRWDEDGLLHLVVSYAGMHVARYKKGKSPGDQSHGAKRSDQIADLSNHSFGTAFDINAENNAFGAPPALVPHRGALRELVPAANALGFFWGGHFNQPKDGMHFELARLDS